MGPLQGFDTYHHMQVNWVDVQAVHSMIADRGLFCSRTSNTDSDSLLRNLVSKVSVGVTRATEIDLDNKDIGGKGAAEAVAALLIWSSPTLTTLRRLELG